jgi:hypothetical protein
MANLIGCLDDEDEDMVPKLVENAEKTRNTGKSKRKGASTGAEEKDEKSPFFRLYKSTCQKIWMKNLENLMFFFPKDTFTCKSEHIMFL